MHGLNNKLEVLNAELDKSVALASSDSVMKRVFGELDRLYQEPAVDLSWFSQMVDLVIFCQQTEIGFSHAKAYALAIVHANWEELSLDIRKQFGLNFYIFAKTVTGREISTIDNYIRTAKVWFIDKAIPTGTIRKPIRNPDGTPKANEATGEVEFEDVEFNAYTVDMTKLLLMNSRAAAGNMTPRLWELLADPYATCEDLRIENTRESNGDGSNGELCFYFRGPILFAKENGEEVIISEDFNWYDYYYGDPDNLVQRALRYMMDVLHMPKLDEEIIIDQEHREKLNKGIIDG